MLDGFKNQRERAAVLGELRCRIAEFEREREAAIEPLRARAKRIVNAHGYRNVSNVTTDEIERIKSAFDEKIERLQERLVAKSGRAQGPVS
jgi:hypothetical protein